MGQISTADARSLFTKMLVDVYRERTAPTAFLRSFFKTVESGSKIISIEVQRGTEKIAVDVERGTEGNRNSFSKSTEKLFVPPYYREWFDATDLDTYDRLFGSSDTIDSAAFGALLESIADKYRLLQDKIERAYELQCAQVLETGIVTLNSGINIDFKRKSAHLVDGSATTWATGTNNPYEHLAAGAVLLRQNGKAQGGVFNCIMGTDAHAAFLANATVIERADIRNFALDSVRAPQRDSVGAVLHGEVSIGSHRVRIWTYPEYYDNAAGVQTPYINAKKIIMIPEVPRFTLAFGAVPMLKDGVIAPRKGAFHLSNYIDERKEKHVFDIKSAGVAIPVAVDQIYTRQVIA